MLYYLWYWLGYEMDCELKRIDEGYEVIIKKDDHIYLRKQFDKNFAYQDVVNELKKILKPI